MLFFSIIALTWARSPSRSGNDHRWGHTFATLAISAGENINWVARMLGHKSPVMTLEKYNRFVPNLTRADGKALLHMGAMVKRSGVPENYLLDNQ